MNDDEPGCSKITKVSNYMYEKPLKKLKTKENNNQIGDEDTAPDWNDSMLLAEQKNLDYKIAENVIKLFENGNTIPFIARYRRDATGNMSPEMLREVKESFEEICHLKSKINTTIKSLNKLGQLNPQLHRAIKSVRTTEELEIIYAPFKPGGKRTLAERAKELGLEEPAMNILNNIKVDLNHYIIPGKKELSKKEDVEKGVIHIIAYVIATDTELLSYLRELRGQVNFMLETKKSQSKQDSKIKIVDKKNAKGLTKGKQIDESKFENYFDYKIPVKYIKPHQILAINRGENQKILSVKVVVPDYLFNKFSQFCNNKWVRNGNFDFNRNRLIEEAIKDSYNRLVQPFIIREIRAELKTQAEKSSCDVFSVNLKHLLLIAPLKGKPILAIDPGYTNGCKLALVSPTGYLLSHDVIFPHKGYEGKKNAASILKNMLEEYKSSASWCWHVSARFKKKQLEESLNEVVSECVSFVGVDLNTASRCLLRHIAGLSEKRATNIIDHREKNGPFLYRKQITDVAGIGARVFEQCAGFLRVGPTDAKEAMHFYKKPKTTKLDCTYIHPESYSVANKIIKKINLSPGEIGESSFIDSVKSKNFDNAELSKELGTSEETVKLILETLCKPLNYDLRCEISQVPLFKKGLTSIYQISTGTIVTGRVKNVTHFGCFVDIGVENDGLIHNSKLNGCNLQIGNRVEAKVINIEISKKKNCLGSCESSFIDSVKSKNFDNAELSKELGTSEETVKLILETLCKPLNYDLRCEISQVPLFKKGLTSIYQISTGTIVTGRVKNVTHFGCFVDIGVENDGLIHNSKLNGCNLQIGNRVEAKIINIEISKKRIALEAVKKL
ncbi:hypothetical protein NQ314_002816 [Rhamnusium bicolor]|uniref:S1 motif domain-containing protein n=1 Tax=Rhamnusium bicolor TaxID=1586634 RepID=A0AAV8ZRZ3_9CUCU|nr:hypothetical protein NQ314_002816 [Rhamnusium bicolor]